MLNLFRRRPAPPTYTSPGGHYYPLYKDIAESGNVLIAGTTGSGKSVLLNGILYSLLADTFPANMGLYLIDPKRVELRGYKDLPHTVAYADTLDGAISVLDGIRAEMQRRYRVMASRGERSYTGSRLYVFIDELADLMTMYRSAALPRLQSLAATSRAARINIIAATQSPSRLTIPAALTLNFNTTIALHCRSAIESRQIIGENGAEDLARYGEAIIKMPGAETQYYHVPLVPDEKINERVAFWARQKRGK